MKEYYGDVAEKVERQGRRIDNVVAATKKMQKKVKDTNIRVNKVEHRLAETVVDVQMLMQEQFARFRSLGKK